MKSFEQVLMTILKIDNRQGEFFNLESSLEAAHPELTQEQITDILDRLKKMKLINTSALRMTSSTRFIKVNPAAYSYFENKEFKDEPEVMVMAEHLEITEAQPWINKKELFIYIAGFFSGVFAMWIKGLFFF